MSLDVNYYRCFYDHHRSKFADQNDDIDKIQPNTQVLCVLGGEEAHFMTQYWYKQLAWVFFAIFLAIAWSFNVKFYTYFLYHMDNCIDV